MAGGTGDYTFKFRFDLTQPVASARSAFDQIAKDATRLQNRLDQLAPGKKKPAEGTPERAEYDRVRRVYKSASTIQDQAADLRANNAILTQRIALTGEIAQERLKIGRAHV